MEIKPNEISSLIKEQIKEFKNSSEFSSDLGTVVTVGDGIAVIYGLRKCILGELLEFPNSVFGMVMNLEEDSVSAVLLGEGNSIKEGDTIKSKILVLKSAKVTGIRYTPDFYFRYGELDVYIEAKGIENDVFYIKKKLFIKYLDDWFIKTKQHSIYFEIYTKKQLLQAIEIIKEYEPTLSKDSTESTMSTT